MNPCPWCKQTSFLRLSTASTLHGGCNHVCTYCNIVGPLGKTYEEALKKWNEWALKTQQYPER